MSSYDIAPGVAAALEGFHMPERLGFGLVAAPVMYSVDWERGEWGQGQLLPYGAHIPGASGQTRYLRPFLFGTESGYLIRNSTTCRFMVIANPVEAYAPGR